MWNGVRIITYQTKNCFYIKRIIRSFRYLEGFTKQSRTINSVCNKVWSVSSPGRLLPLLHASVSEGELVQLGEQIVRYVLLVIVLRPEDELDSLRRRVCSDTTTNVFIASPVHDINAKRECELKNTDAPYVGDSRPSSRSERSRRFRWCLCPRCRCRRRLCRPRGTWTPTYTALWPDGGNGHYTDPTAQTGALIHQKPLRASLAIHYYKWGSGFF